VAMPGGTMGYVYNWFIVMGRRSEGGYTRFATSRALTRLVFPPSSVTIGATLQRP